MGDVADIDELAGMGTMVGLAISDLVRVTVECVERRGDRPVLTISIKVLSSLLEI